MIKLKEGAVLVADAHYASYRPLFHTLIDKIISKEIQTTQLLLMGDVFDLLMGPIKIFVETEKIIIEKLNKLSLEIEIIYLEGNHDFQLSSIFPHMRIYPLGMQPVKSTFKNQEGFLAHGDWGGSLSYRLYSSIIRNHYVLKFLSFTDFVSKNKMSERFYKKMQKKLICSKFEDFDHFINEKFKNHDNFYGWFIEGHYHQGSSFLVDEMFYHNLEAMACNKSYFVVQSSNNVIALSRYTL